MVLIPDDKRYFRIGEASRIIGVEPYVLRYWESAFSQIRPQRAGSKQRIYQRKDLETLLEIKKLLYDERMTVEGARKRLGKQQDAKMEVDRRFLAAINTELHEILDILT
ncbi:MAG: MerR family transcriptional regulator [Thermodesulfobacteriota bacterium]|nr:MerR family transcriptional regulator [Thermodesulfobacteriota bacterium]